MHGVFYLSMVMPVYVLMNHLTNIVALHKSGDFIYLYSDMAIPAVQTTILCTIVASIVSKPDLNILFKRLALGYLLKGIIQFVTVIPQPDEAGGAAACKNIPIYKLRGCADMMYSGHTMFVMLLLYKYKYRGFVVFFMAFELVLAKWHYMSDCIVAVLACIAIESKITF